MQETFEFELDVDLPDQIIESLEDQLVEEVQQKFGSDYSGDDIADFGFSFKAEVTVNKKGDK